jgi:hypothetical protein
MKGFGVIAIPHTRVLAGAVQHDIALRFQAALEVIAVYKIRQHVSI